MLINQLNLTATQVMPPGRRIPNGCPDMLPRVPSGIGTPADAYRLVFQRPIDEVK